MPWSTLAGWCRDIRLTDHQVAAIRARTASRRGVPRDTQRRRRAEIERIRATAREFATAHLHDPLFVAGTVLYWGEGAKTHHPLALSNSDPAALRLFISWVRTYHTSHAVFVLSLQVHDGNDDTRARAWWAMRSASTGRSSRERTSSHLVRAIARTTWNTGCARRGCGEARTRGSGPWNGSTPSRRR